MDQCEPVVHEMTTPSTLLPLLKSSGYSELLVAVVTRALKLHEVSTPRFLRVEGASFMERSVLIGSIYLAGKPALPRLSFCN